MMQCDVKRNSGNRGRHPPADARSGAVRRRAAPAGNVDLTVEGAGSVAGRAVAVAVRRRVRGAPAAVGSSCTSEPDRRVSPEVRRAGAAPRRRDPREVGKPCSGSAEMFDAAELQCPSGSLSIFLRTVRVSDQVRRSTRTTFENSGRACVGSLTPDSLPVGTVVVFRSNLLVSRAALLRRRLSSRSLERRMTFGRGPMQRVEARPRNTGTWRERGAGAIHLALGRLSGMRVAGRRRRSFCPSAGTCVGAPASAEGEARKVVTVVFSDVAGSTALGRGLDPESLRRSCRATSRRCRRCSSGTAAWSRSSSATR